MRATVPLATESAYPRARVRAHNESLALGEQRDGRETWLIIAFAAVGVGVSAETRTLAIVAEQHTDAMMPRGSAMAAQQLRRVKLIERQRDQSESEAVSSARARQRPMPAYSSLPPLTPGPRPSAGDRDRGPSEVIVKACPEPCPELSISDPR